MIWPASSAAVQYAKDTGVQAQYSILIFFRSLTRDSDYLLDRLRLNRPPLLALRRTRRDVVLLGQALTDAQIEQAHLRERIVALEGTLQSMLAQIARLLEG